jgi:hypothetical protein
VLIASIVCKSGYNSLCRRKGRGAYCPCHRASIWRHHRNRARQSDQLLPQVEVMRGVGSNFEILHKMHTPNRTARFQDWICALPFLHVPCDAILVICSHVNRTTSVTFIFYFVNLLAIRLEAIFTRSGIPGNNLNYSQSSLIPRAEIHTPMFRWGNLTNCCVCT